MPYAPAALIPAARHSARRMLLLRQIELLGGSTEGLRCLDIGGEGGWTSALLRARGGEWTTADLPGPALETARHLCGDQRVVAFENDRLPLDDQSFDMVVLVDILERIDAAAELIRETHRVLKPAGRLLINAPFAVRIAPLRLLRRALAPDGAPSRPAYTVAGLFDLLKDGFDLQDCRRYSRLLIEAADLATARAARRYALAEASGRPDPITICRAQAAAWRRFGWLSWTAAQLDAFLFLSPGYRLMARARRRLWIPRKAPVLSDGRSVAEAALSGRIGTASQWTAPA